MPAEALELTFVLPVAPKRIYEAWLDARQHADMTGGAAEIDARVGGAHTAWDGYIRGETLGLEPGRRIVQSWRTAEFATDDPDSRLEIELEAQEGGTRVVLRHSNLPEGGKVKYSEGWQDAYIEPMLRYFDATDG